MIAMGWLALFHAPLSQTTLGVPADVVSLGLCVAGMAIMVGAVGIGDALTKRGDLHCPGCGTRTWDMNGLLRTRRCSSCDAHIVAGRARRRSAFARLTRSRDRARMLVSLWVLTLSGFAALLFGVHPLLVFVASTPVFAIAAGLVGTTRSLRYIPHVAAAGIMLIESAHNAAALLGDGSL
jgi:hypothetical protein